MGKYLLGMITALIFIAALVVWFSRPGAVNDGETPADGDKEGSISAPVTTVT